MTEARIGTVRHLRALGFEGFIPLKEVSLDSIPNVPGVYAVAAAGRPVPIARSVGGWFKGKDPTVGINVLATRLQAGAEVLYFGKADAGAAAKRGLRSRIKELLRFGNGEPVGHWGGRYLWQLLEAETHLIAWLPVIESSAEHLEKELLREFLDEYGVLPFANLRM